MMGIKAILFDFGGTLDSDGVHWYARLYEGICRQDPTIDEEFFYVEADKAARAASLCTDTRELTLGGMVGRLCGLIRAGMEAPSGARLNWDAHEVAAGFLAEANGYLTRNRQVLAQLRRRYRLGCISNNWGNTVGWCRESGLEGYFETIIDSAVVGSAKPKRQIFEAALTALRLPAGACAYVGDSYDSDVVGAYEAGLLPIWITHDGQEPPEAAVAARRIGSLTELLAMEWE